MARQKLTVLIPCKDEELNIQPCIESVREIADELLIADSGSTDRTLELVARIGDCRVIQREFIDAGNFKNWAIPQATHEWVLVIDADERVTSELALEIRKTLDQGHAHDGYWIRRSNFFMGHPVRHTSWGRDKVIRLFQRDLGRYREHTDHSEIDLPKERLAVLSGALIHYTCWNYDDYLQKMHHYTEQQAQVWYEQGRKPSLFRLMFNGPLRFFRDYILHRGILDGRTGFQVSALTGFYSFQKQARLWHKHCARHPGEI